MHSRLFVMFIFKQMFLRIAISNYILYHCIGPTYVVGPMSLQFDTSAKQDML